MHAKRSSTAASTCMCILMIMPGSAYAYLDPGTGSFMLQTLIAALVGAVFSIKLLRRKMIAFLKGLFSKKGSGDHHDR